MGALEKSVALTLASGLCVLIRTPTRQDGLGLEAFEQKVASESSLQGIDKEENPPLLKERRKFLEDRLSDPSALLLVAEHEGEIIGYLESSPRDRTKMTSHVLHFYLSIMKEFWGKGLGTALIDIMIEWAKTTSITKISLNVLSQNKRAIALYKKLGFLEEGKKLREFRMPDGSFSDEILMAKFLGRD